jgi:hypothetical protein
MFRIALSLCAALFLAACGAGVTDAKWAPDEAVAAARFVEPEGPREVTLYTVINNRSQAGAHSGLVIKGAETLMFDPAGSWKHPRIPERNDVHFGITPRMRAFYIDYHARETFRVVEQTVQVPPEVAETIIARAKAYGAVPQAQCANSITTILSDVPGFESIGRTWFPKRLSEDFAKLPGVRTRVITDDDADQNHGVLIVQAGAGPA